MPRTALVVGAGVFGASLADRLARSGWAVELVERLVPGTPRSGSGDDTRLIRFSHGDDVWHTRSARRALQLWRELDPTLLDQRGVTWFARRADGWEAESERVLRAEGIACERVDPGARFPGVRDDDLAFALHEPEAGVLFARRATRALAARAVQAGARLRTGVTARPDGERAVLSDGTVVEADVVIWACGAWLPALFPGVVDLRLTQQDVFFFATPGGAWSSAPGWVDYDGAVYGHGDADGQGLKVAPDEEGPPADPDAADRRVLDTSLARARAQLAHRFPVLAGAPLAAARACHYELTADTRFVLAPHPEHGGRVWLAGGGSGHGFKHGPALAERLERWVGGDEPPDPQFGLGPRAVDVTLRTASVTMDP
ncbi:FAD-binding oxidoreductase [Conexibacter sp. SYSU D00693]|uniref:NAD(P)/FAD-dependent oxidoreductase n=1 Tax=Conexibacter sp. SYSU D00693 TaxID=2812560 RepID=UPI00196BA3D9|nr:FAD-dependent oxidoreductase [Conexibacter sp. SYSU D00693]